MLSFGSIRSTSSKVRVWSECLALGRLFSRRAILNELHSRTVAFDPLFMSGFISTIGTSSRWFGSDQWPLCLSPRREIRCFERYGTIFSMRFFHGHIDSASLRRRENNAASWRKGEKMSRHYVDASVVLTFSLIPSVGRRNFIVEILRCHGSHQRPRERRILSLSLQWGVWNDSSNIKLNGSLLILK